MKTKKSIFIFSIVLTCILFQITILPAQSQMTYSFERMWPNLRQPWYFSYARGIAVDANGNLFISDTYKDCVQKFNANGEFIMRWGSSGSDTGQFQTPLDIAIDATGNVYVADSVNHRIQKFSNDGRFISAWGSQGDSDGRFNTPNGVAVDRAGNIYVADTFNHRIQKFDPGLKWVTEWGQQGSENGRFNEPRRIAVTPDGNILVTDSKNHRIQKFDSDGSFLATWGSLGSGNTHFNLPEGITVDRDGMIYTADIDEPYRVRKFNPDGTYVSDLTAGTYISDIASDNQGNIYLINYYGYQIKKYRSDGLSLSQWGCRGSQDGWFYVPEGMAIDKKRGYLYVADGGNNRIQKFSLDGTFQKVWGSDQLENPKGIAVDDAGNVYVGDSSCRIRKYNADGVYIRSWGSRGAGQGEFDSPRSIAIDPDGNIYVAEDNNHRIQKLSSDGEFILQWGTRGSGDGQFNQPFGVTVGTDGNIFVADLWNDRVQKFTSQGVYIAQWGSGGTDYGQFSGPCGISAGRNGDIFVVDKWNHRVQQFDANGTYIAAFGKLGSDPERFTAPGAVCVDSDGRAFIADTANCRIQVFVSDSQSMPPTNRIKAVIVAGGGPYPGNNLWDATQMCANFAYRALIYQGYGKSDIYYLSHDLDLDMDGDGRADDVDADAENKNLEYALTQWAADADDLLIYMVDHGGRDTFRMRSDQLLTSQELDGWLDTLQQKISGKVVLVYDACRSGSFLEKLTPVTGKERILVTSTTSDQESIFAAHGKISFSFIFWAGIFNGSSFYNAYTDAVKSIEITFDQTPQIEADGNGTGNEKTDKSLAQSVRISNEILSAGDIPVVGTVSEKQTLYGETSAVVFADNITDADGINRVWAIITPPGYSTGSSDIPAIDLPSVNLVLSSTGRHEAIYSGFDTKGTYNIAVYAEDQMGTISIPVQTTVIQTAGKNPAPDEGYLVTDNLWIQAVIQTVEKGQIQAKWQKGGEDRTTRGDRVIWGHFYADPGDVTWGSADNPDLFVKIWFDAGGRIDVNFFHVSVPDIHVFSDYPYDGASDEQSITTTSLRYVRHYYENGVSDSENSPEDGNPPAGYAAASNPTAHQTLKDLLIGATIRTVEKGAIDALWRKGGQGTTDRGDQVLWGLFYADPEQVTWGSRENPDVFVKVWFDAGGRLDVNFFHVSVPDIEVFSGTGGSNFSQKGTAIMENRYIRHEYAASVAP